MKILEQIQPRENISAQKINLIKKEVVKIDREVISPQSEQITSYINLDSMTKVESKLVQDAQETQETDFTISTIMSYCNENIKFKKQFNCLDEEYKNKFMDELDYLILTLNDNYNNQIIKFLSQNYDRIDFSLEILIDTDMNKSNLTINDSLYFKDDIIIIPNSYQYIITDLLQCLNIDKRIMMIQDTRIVPLDENPMRRIHNSQIRIYTTNHQWCHRCEFYNICDQKLI